MNEYEVDITVKITDSIGPIRKMRVQREDGKDGIPWDDLQRLKDKYLGEDSTAIEVYPPSHEVVDEINARHLWEWSLHEPCPYSLLNK